MATHPIFFNVAARKVFAIIKDKKCVLEDRVVSVSRCRNCIFFYGILRGKKRLMVACGYGGQEFKGRRLMRDIRFDTLYKAYLELRKRAKWKKQNTDGLEMPYPLVSSHS